MPTRTPTVPCDKPDRNGERGSRVSSSLRSRIWGWSVCSLYKYPHPRWLTILTRGYATPVLPREGGPVSRRLKSRSPLLSPIMLRGRGRPASGSRSVIGPRGSAACKRSRVCGGSHGRCGRSNPIPVLHRLAFSPASQDSTAVDQGISSSKRANPLCICRFRPEIAFSYRTEEIIIYDQGCRGLHRYSQNRPHILLHAMSGGGEAYRTVQHVEQLFQG